MWKYTEKMENLEHQAKTTLLFIFVMIALNILMIFLAVYAIKNRVTVLQLPPVGIHENVVYARNEASKSAFDMWTRYIVSTIGNYTPHSIDDAIYIILSKAYPESHSHLSANLSELSAHVKKNRIRQSFHPDWRKASIEIRKNYALAIVEGKEIREIGGKRDEITTIYKIKMVIEGGHIYLVELNREEK